jgi:hypothetical protein
MSRLPTRQKTSQTKPNQAPQANPKTLLFALEQVGGQVQYRLYSAEHSVKGWQDIETYTPPSNLEQLHGFAKPDRSLLQALRTAQSRPSAQNHALEDNDLAAYLLERLLGTKRLFWQHPQHGVWLERGAPRKGKLFWQMLPDGTQRPMAQTEPPSQALLGLSGLWYVDSTQKHIGRLETALQGLRHCHQKRSRGCAKTCTSVFPACPCHRCPARSRWRCPVWCA